MANQTVNVDFVVNGGQYGASLQQMIAVTQQYNQVVDTMLGRVAKLGGTITSKLVSSTDKMTQANKIATSQAAAYQQKLSALEATAKIAAEKTFPKLEKATLKLARDFPVGMDQAVAQMEALQESGVTNVDQIAKLSESYTRLGAATNSFGPAVGKQMTEFTRTMGNSMEMVDGFGDSLTTLTKKYGGSASSVLAFSKSIAPVAQVMGMNQSEVMGLSTAFARLGEDGFAAGNALSKVMIDLNRAARDGGPELRQYAQVLNKDIGELRAQIDESPASVMVDFTQAIQKQGPNAIRTLEMLGMEGVRTTRAITALAREGNLGEIISTATDAYGSGSSAEAAETAMSGVNDQMQMLQERTSQMISAAGKPFLSWLEGVLGTANKVADVFTRIVSSDFAQKLAKVGAVADTVGTAAVGVFGSLGTVALGMRAVNAAPRFRQQWRAGRAAGAGGMSRDDLRATEDPTGVLTPLAMFAGNWLGSGRAYGANSPERRARAGQGFTRTAIGAIRGAGNVGLAGAALAMNVMASDYRGAMGMAGVTTPGGQRFMGEASASRAMWKAGDTAGATQRLSKAVNELGQAAAKGQKPLGSAAMALANMATAGLALGGGGLAKVGKAGFGASVRGVSAMAGMAVSPWLVGGALVAGAGYGAYKYAKARDTTEGALDEERGGAYGTFNQFAEKAGIATKSLTVFGDSLDSAARKVQNAATRMDMFSLSSKEAAVGASGDYQKAWEFKTDQAEVEAHRFFLSGGTQSPEATTRFLMDVTAEHGASKASKIGEYLEELAGQDFEGMIKSGLDRAESERNWAGIETDSTRATIQGLADSMQQSWAREGELKGEDAMNAKKEEDIATLMGMRGTVGREQGKYLDDLIADALGVETKDFLASVNGRGGYGSPGSIMGAAPKGTTDTESWADQLESMGAPKEVVEAARNRAGGKELGPEQNVMRMAQKDAEQWSNAVGSAVTSLTDTLYAGADKAAEYNVKVDELTEAQKRTLTSTQRLVLEAQQAPTDFSKQAAAATAILEQTFEETGGDVAATMATLTTAIAAAPEGGQKELLQAALSRAGINSEIVGSTSQMLGYERSKLKFDTAMQVLSVPPPESPSAEDQAKRDQAEADIAAVRTENAQAFAGYLKQVRSAMIGMERSQEDESIQRGRAEANFERSQRWAKKDYQRQVFLAERQFNTAMADGEKDYNKQRSRARRDFRRQETRQEEAYHRQRSRAVFDFNKQMGRAEEDYQLSRRRSVHDHNKQQRRAESDHNRSMRRSRADYRRGVQRGEEDFNLQIARSKEDFNRQAARQEEDHARSQQRALDDYNRSVLRAEDDHNRNRSRAWQDYSRQVSRAVEDQNRSLLRAEDDFGKQMSRSRDDHRLSQLRAQEDYDKQLVRMAEDNAKAMYDPYQRLSHKRTWDMKQLISNVKQQNEVLKRQMEAVDEMKSMGLSQSAVDFFGFADPQNAQQAIRALADMMSSPETIEQLNAAVSGRMDLSTMFVNDEDNVGTRRMAEDFAMSLERQNDDFAKAMERQTEDFRVSRERQVEDFARSLDRQLEDFRLSLSRQDEDFKRSMNRQSEDFMRNRARQDADFRRSMSRQSDDFERGLRRQTDDYRKSMSRQAEDFERSMRRQNKDFERSMDRQNKDFKKSLARQDADFKKSVVRQRDDFKEQLDRMGKDYRIARGQARKDFKIGLSDMAKDYKEMRKRANRDHDRQMAEMDKNFAKQTRRATKMHQIAMDQMTEDGARARARLVKDLERAGKGMTETWQDLIDEANEFIARAPEKHRKKLEKAVRLLRKHMVDEFEKKPPTVPINVEMNFRTGKVDRSKLPPWLGGTADVWGGEGGPDADIGSGSGLLKATAGKGSRGASFMQRGRAWSWGRVNGVGMHDGADIRIGPGEPVYATRKGRIVRIGTGGWAGNHVVWKTDGGTQFIYAHLSSFGKMAGEVKKGTFLGRVGSTGNSSGPHLHVQASRGGTYVNPERYLSQGGIVTRPTVAAVAEAGHSEAVIPLNDRGAKFLGDLLIRYVGAHEARHAQVSRSTTTIVRNSTFQQDYSTNFTGPVEVRANDPGEFADAMRRRARMRSLVKPIGGER